MQKACRIRIRLLSQSHSPMLDYESSHCDDTRPSGERTQMGKMTTQVKRCLLKKKGLKHEKLLSETEAEKRWGLEDRHNKDRHRKKNPND